jgi:hypothetical protein
LVAQTGKELRRACDPPLGFESIAIQREFLVARSKAAAPAAELKGNLSHPHFGARH